MKHFLTHARHRWICSFVQRANSLPWYMHLIKKMHSCSETRITCCHLQCFSSCNSTTHKMLLPNKQAHQQNKLSPHVRAIGETGLGKCKTSSVNKHLEKKRPTVSRPVHSGSVTCDSLILLSGDRGTYKRL